MVAAAYPDGAAVTVGTEIPLGPGEIGFAAEAQMVVNRQDLQAETAREPHQARARPARACPSRS